MSNRFTGEVAFMTAADLENWVKADGTPMVDRTPRPQPDISNLSDENWKRSLPITEDDIEWGEGLAHQGNLEVVGRSGVRKRHPFGDNPMVCSAFSAHRRLSYRSWEHETAIKLLEAVINAEIAKRFREPDQARKIVWARLRETFEKLEDLCGEYHH